MERVQLIKIYSMTAVVVDYLTLAMARTIIQKSESEMPAEVQN